MSWGRSFWPLVPIVLLFALFLALVDPVTRGLAAVWTGEAQIEGGDQ